MVRVARRHLQIVLAASALLLAGGCTGLGLQNRQEQQFSASLEMLKAGEVRRSHELLEEVVNAPKVHGMTDEALFRLSLLLLTEEIAPKNAPRAQALLERLRKEYPESSWTPHARLLLDWLTSPKGGRDRDREQINHLLWENRELLSFRPETVTF